MLTVSSAQYTAVLGYLLCWFCVVLTKSQGMDCILPVHTLQVLTLHDGQHQSFAEIFLPS